MVHLLDSHHLRKGMEWPFRPLMLAGGGPSASAQPPRGPPQIIIPNIWFRDKSRLGQWWWYHIVLFHRWRKGQEEVKSSMRSSNLKTSACPAFPPRDKWNVHICILPHTTRAIQEEAETNNPARLLEPSCMHFTAAEGVPLSCRMEMIFFSSSLDPVAFNTHCAHAH